MEGIQEMKFYLRIGSGDSKGSYSGKMLQSVQVLSQGNGIETAGLFIISYILILCLKEKVHGVETKTATTGGDFKLVTIVFFDYG